MSGRPWYAFYPDAYERAAGDLTYVQDSAYRRLLDHYYKTCAPLSLDKKSLYRACRALRKEERAAIDFCLETFFEKEPYGYHQARADMEIARAADVSAKRAQAASKRHSKTDAIAEQLHTHSTATSTVTKEDKKQDAALRAVAVREPVIEIPEWIPKVQWEAFMEVRKGLRAKNTNRAILLLVADLKKLHHSDDIGEVLDQSIKNSWKSVFPVKHQGQGNGQRRAESAHDKFNAGAALAIASFGSDADGPGETAPGSDVDRPELALLAS